MAAHIFLPIFQIKMSHSIHIWSIQIDTRSNWLIGYLPSSSTKSNCPSLQVIYETEFSRKKSKCFVLRLYTKLFLLPGVVAVLKKFPHLLVTQDEAIFAPKKFLIMPRH